MKKPDYEKNQETALRMVRRLKLFTDSDIREAENILEELLPRMRHKRQAWMRTWGALHAAAAIWDEFAKAYHERTSKP